MYLWSGKANKNKVDIVSFKVIVIFKTFRVYCLQGVGGGGGEGCPTGLETGL